MFKIDNNEEFELKGLVGSWTEDGYGMAINYKKDTDAMTVIIEAEGVVDKMIAKKSITYKEFKKTYPKHRVYLQGYIQIGE